MKSYITLGSVLLITFSPIALADLTHSAGDILYRRTDNLPGADFTGQTGVPVDNGDGTETVTVRTLIASLHPHGGFSGFGWASVGEDPA